MIIMQREVAASYFNLEKANILVVDGDPMGTTIITQILSGFGARNLQKCASVDEAKAHVQRSQFDLILVEPASCGPGGYDFIPWLRKSCPPPNKFAPVLVLTGHTQASRVASVRDGGANFVVAKPLTPARVFERIMWMAREKRPYVDGKNYAGPDRRWKFEGPPTGSDGRREGDLSAEVGQASEPNMSQADIDAMVQPRKVTM